MNSPAKQEHEVPKLQLLFSEEQIRGRVAELARRISDDYRGRPLLTVGVLKGAWVFLADLVRRLTIPVRCDFVRLSSYGAGTATSGKVACLLDVSLPLEGAHVLVVEDIVDTGLSLRWLVEHLRAKNPASVRLCALLDKPCRRAEAVTPDYTGFEIGDYFVVGYGIDCAEQHRQLPCIYALVQDGE